MSVSYPCIQCFEHCKEPCIQCFRCERWVHITCVPMTENELKSWDSHLLNFYCQQCCFNGVYFDAKQSLDRLQLSLDSGRRNALLTTARNEQKLLETYNVYIPEPENFNLCKEDTVSNSVLKMFHPALLEEFYTASVIGDGNCMYRAVSLAISGSECYHILLRLRTAIEIALHRQYYDQKLKNHNDLIADNRVVVSDYNTLLSDAVKLGSYSELAHIYALSASISKPIRSYFPPQIYSELISEPFSRKVVGRNVNESRESIATVMWTQTHTPLSLRDFHPNHFVPVLLRTAPITEVIDLNNSSNNSQTDTLSVSTPQFHKSVTPVPAPGASAYDSPNPSHISEFENSDSEILQTNEISDISSCDVTLTNNDANSSEMTVINNDSVVEDDTVDDTVVSEADDMSSDPSDPCSNDDSATSAILFDEKTSGNLSGVFMDVPKVIRVLAENESPLDYIPEGIKENVYFVVKNDQNIENRSKNHRSNFRDDCGVWDSARSATPKTSYLILPNGELKKIVWKNGAYCNEKKVKGKYEYIPLNPQPTEKEILQLHRYYTSLKMDKNFRKRVSWLSLGGNEHIALVEYIGKYPGLTPHGNAKQKPEYIRTPNAVMQEMGEMLKSHKPQHVYDKLTSKYDELSGPANHQQVYNKKRYDKNKERKQNGYVFNRNNIADHIKQIENLVSASHPFIKSVVRQTGKAPCIVLYSEEQITDLKLLCCTGQTVLGVDKTFNLCDMHVTVTCYKQLSVTNVKNSEHPLFFGPLFIHDNSDFETYCIFFSHLKIKLSDVDTSKLVFGTDDEKAMVNAITSSFPDSKHMLCTRHLRQNANQKLTDAAVDKSDRNMILNKIFGDGGILDADDTVCFEEKCEEVETLSQSISQTFLRYFQKRLRDNLQKKRADPEILTAADKHWTNNNCESLNHVLKQAVEWKSKPLMDFIETAHELVLVQYKDLRRSLIGTGQFQLAETHKQFKVDRTVWAGKNSAEREKTYKRFRSFMPKHPRLVVSTDGESDVVAPRTKGKKLGQTKRKRTERTVSQKKVKV